jgi:hypothetical protein
LTLRDLDGHALVAPPSTLPAREGKPPSPKVFVRLLVEKVWAADPIFRLRCVSLSNASAETGGYHTDKTLAAYRILEQAKTDDITAVTDLGSKVISKIEKRWLPDILAERNLGRQARIAAAIKQGQELAAQAATEANPSE